MKKATLLFVGFLFLLISCKEKAVFDQFDTDFESNRWLEKDVKTYDFTIDDDAKLYTITFAFSHVYDYQFSSVPLNIKIVGPSGKEETMTIDLQIKDASGKQLADCSGDVCDLFYKIKEKTKLEKGAYKVTLSHSFTGPYLPNVIGVGLTVEEAK
jgi:gliding motility-associated lipoprotein GldH